MEPKVSADTITDISAAAAFSRGAGGPAPTAEELTRQIRKHMTSLIELTDKKLHPQRYDDGHDRKQRPEISHGEAVSHLQEFDKIVANVPKGFRLAPVLYSRNKFDQNDDVYIEFELRIRAEFLRFLAEQHADELRSLGICESGIALMKEGKEPLDEAGHFYDINIDHIIERSGSGTMGTTQDIDPARAPGSPPSYRVNHFSNFILLPVQIHQIKNKLNELQRTSEVPPGHVQWVLMMVPEATPGHSGYVAQPQGDTGELGTTSLNLQAHYVDPISASTAMIHRLDRLIKKSETSPEQKEKMQPFIASALDEAAERLRAAFNKAAQPKRDFKPFRRFYEGDDFKTLRVDMDKVPPQDAWKARKIIKEIDEGVSARFNRKAGYHPEPANQNNRQPDWARTPQHQPHRHKRHGKKKHR